jgi:hypothetical protein
MKVQLHIERLVLDGIDNGGAPRLLQAAIQAELTRLIGEGGLGHAQGGAVARVSGPAISLQAGEPAALVGSKIAGAVYGGIKR